LKGALDGLSVFQSKEVLEGYETLDDAGIFRLDDNVALVQTLDFFTPILDDPYEFGQAAVANSLSDVYAMGGRPLFALNIVCFPMKTLGPEVLGRILAGGAAVADEAGIPIVGGHTVDDAEPKYGMSVTGIVHPDRILRNVGARPGDVLFLTKPLGSGILTTVIKRGGLDAEALRRTVGVMTTLNRSAAEAMLEVGAVAATDVTGFGLLGHLAGMLRGGGLGAQVSASKVPFLPGVVEFAEKGFVPGGSKRNLDYFGAQTTFDPSIGPALRLALADAQTSGGILVACPPDRADAMERRLRERGTLAAARIGGFTAEEAGRIRVVP
jgi:selenide,water dikinase